MKKLFLMLSGICIASLSLVAQAHYKVGSAVLAPEANPEYFTSVKFVANGLIRVRSEKISYTNGNNETEYKTTIYISERQADGSFAPKGQALEMTPTLINNAVYEVAITPDGQRLASSDSVHNLTFACELNCDDGQVRFFDYNATTNTWDIDSSLTIDAPGTNGRFGSGLAIDQTGTRVIVGANNDSSFKGCIYVYDYSTGSGTWLQVGSVCGEVNDDKEYLAGMSADGSTFITKSFHYDKPAGNDPTTDPAINNAGRVRVWKIAETTNVITQELDIIGHRGKGMNGGVAISADGDTVAIGRRLLNSTGVTGENGTITVYQYGQFGYNQRGSLMTASVIGNDYFGWGEEFGHRVAMTADGNRIVGTAMRGRPANADPEDAYPGTLRVFDWDETASDWVQAGKTFHPAYALNANGEVVQQWRRGTLPIPAFANIGMSLVDDGRAVYLASSAIRWPGDVANGTERVGYYKVEFDTDEDTVTNIVEDAAPNGGDMNEDNILDSLQAGVTSFPLDNGSDYMALASLGSCNTISNVTMVGADAFPADENHTYPLGLLDFDATCTSSSGNANLEIYLADNYDTTGWLVKTFSETTGLYTDISDITTIGTSDATSVTKLSTLLLEGNPTYDSDGVADGNLNAIIGPATYSAPTSPEAASGDGGGGGAAFALLGMLFSVFGLVGLRRRSMA